MVPSTNFLISNAQISWAPSYWIDPCARELQLRAAVGYPFTNSPARANRYPTLTPSPTPTPTAIHSPTARPAPNAATTPTPTAVTARPTLTPTPAPLPTPTLAPTATPTLTPTPTPTPGVPACDSEPRFNVSPTSFDRIDHIVSLGNLNPPGHTFPTGHMYFYLTNPDPNGITDIATLYSPGNLTVTNLRADQHVVAGFTDYGMTLMACEDIWLSFGHLSALSADLFGEIASYEGWTGGAEHSTGGETYRTWRKEVNVKVTVGEVLGTTGGNPGIWAWDFGMVDLRIRQEKSAVNTERYYPPSWSLSGVCFLL